jgi:hypothetical protein
MTPPPGGPTRPPNTPARPAEPASTGQLVTEIAGDVQKLFRQEVELAKAEVRQEAGKAARAAGMLGGAGIAGYLVILLASLAVVFGLGNLMDLGWAALIVAAGWAVIGAVLFVAGRSRLRSVSPKPERTIETLKENAQWARHPTS